MPVDNSITVAANSRTVVGTNTAFDYVEDDTFFVNGFAAPIDSQLSTSQLLLKTPLSSAAIASTIAWDVVLTSPLRQSNVTIYANVAKLIAALDAGLTLGYDAAGTLGNRAQYDDLPAPFRYIKTDALPFLLYIKRSAAHADWSAGISLQPSPAQTTIEAQQASDLAKSWATALTVEVVAGQGYSAKQYALNAAGSATAAAASATAASTTKGQVDTLKADVTTLKTQTLQVKTDTIAAGATIVSDATAAKNAAADYAAQLATAVFDFNVDSSPSTSDDWNN